VSKFVGQERKAAVMQLVNIFDQTVQSSAPHFVCLLAEAGSGKTRIIQEFYSFLQTHRQPSGDYWPELLDGGDGDIMQSRKVIYPERVTPAAESKMPWLWWGLRCDTDSSGRPIRALLNDRVQLAAHLDQLASIALTRKHDRELVFEVLGEAAAAIPGIGTTIGLAKMSATIGPKLFRRLKQGIESAKKANNPLDIDLTGQRSSRREIDADLALVRNLIARSLPLVIIIDDIHEADPATVSFIIGLMNMPNVPVLVIATSWPSALSPEDESNSEEPETFSELLAYLQRLHAGDCTLVQLNPIDTEDLRELIRDVGPMTTADREAALIESSDRNLLVLNLQLASRKVVRSVSQEAITLTPKELMQLPQEFGSLMAERFRELDELDQRWLAEAALNHGPTFFPDFLGIEIAGTDGDRLAGFVRLSRTGEFSVGRFIERPVLEATQEQARYTFARSEQDEWAVALEAKLEDWWHTRSSLLPEALADRASFYEMFVRIADRLAGNFDLDRAMLAEVAISWSYAERDQDRHEKELFAAEAAVRHADLLGQRGRQLSGEARIRLASAWRAMNEPERGSEIAREAIKVLSSMPESPAALLFEAHCVRCRAIIQGSRDEEEATSEASLAIQAAGDDPEMVVSGLRLRADVEYCWGDDSSAVTTLEKALGIVTQSSGDAETVLDIRTDIEDYKPYLGSVDAWKELESETAMAFGDGNYLHRFCLGNLALCAFFNMQYEEAIRTSEKLLLFEPESYMAQLVLGLYATFSGMQKGKSEVADVMHLGYASAYVSRENQRMAESVITLTKMSYDDMQGKTWSPDSISSDPSLRVIDQARLGLDEAMGELHDLIEDEGASGLDKFNLMFLGYGMYIEGLVEAGEMIGGIGEFETWLQGISEDENFPEMGRFILSALRNLRRLLIGSIAMKVKPSGLIGIDAKYLLAKSTIRHLTGRRDLARIDLREALALLESVDHVSWDLWRSVARTMRRIGYEGELYARQQSVAEAYEGPQRLGALIGLGNCLYLLDQFEEAAKVERDAWKLSNQLGEERFITGTNLAATLEKRNGPGDVESALSLYRDVLSGEIDESQRLKALGFVGGLLFRNGRHTDAEAAQTEALELAMRVGGSDADELILETYGELVRTLEAKGSAEDIDRAVHMWGSCYETISSDYGKLRALAILGAVLYRAERYDEAESAESDAWDIACAMETSEPRFGAGRNLAMTLSKRDGPGDAQRALQLYRSILDDSNTLEQKEYVAAEISLLEARVPELGSERS
jgi:tetratricopeptide (TPR) repeat protein